MERSRSLFTGLSKVFSKTLLLREKMCYVGRVLRNIEECRGEGESTAGRIVLPGPGFAPGTFERCKRVGQYLTFLGHLAKWPWPRGAGGPDWSIMSRMVPAWGLARLSSDQPPSFLSPQDVGSEEEQLCADFPELDLSQLDVSDFDSATCFGELQWCPESSDTEPGQYSPDDQELFQV